MRSFLKPVVEMLQSLYMVGMTIKVVCGAVKTIRAKLLDLVAKASIYSEHDSI